MTAMPADPTRQRLLRLLRRASHERRPRSEPATPDPSAMWSAHERALVRVRDAGAASQRITATAGRQRSAVDAAVERTRALSARVAELQAGSSRALDAFERLSLVALNAGLEGARLGQSDGKPLALVADEVRSHASRGADAARDLGTNLGQLASELAQLESQMAQAQSVVAEVAQDSARGAGAASDAEVALIDMGERVKKTTGSDPEIVRATAEVADRARALVASLSALSGKVPHSLLVGALGPAVESLAHLLVGDGDPGVDRNRGV
jgi:methyl-accepting chemotaxis protein